MTGQSKIPLDSYEKIFQSFLQLVNDSILMVDSDLKIVDANQMAGKMHNIPQEEIMGKDCRNLIAPNDKSTLDKVFRDLKEDENWTGKLKGLRNGDDIFPVEINVNRTGSEGQTYFCIIIRDLSNYKIMEDRLSREKAHRREMYITLRNVMNSVGKEKRGTERLISHKIETLLLPLLERVKKESSKEMRDNYLDMFRQELLSLTKGFPRELDIPFLRLTRMEMKVCQYIQSGYASKEIADALNISFETIQTHRKNIRKKLGLRSRKISLHTFLSTRRNLGGFSKL